MSASEEAIAALAAGFDRLIEDDRHEAAESMALAILGIDQRDAREAFGERSASLGEVRSVALAQRLLEIAQRNRLPWNWPDWLDPIPGDLLGRITQAPEMIDGLGKRLWIRATDVEKPLDQKELDAALGAISRLTEAVPTAEDETAAAISASTAAAPTNTAVAEQGARLLDLASRFVDSRLTSFERFAPAVLDSFGEALRQPIAELGVEEPMALTVTEWGSRLAPFAGDEAREKLAGASEESPWLPAPYKATLAIAAAIREDPGAMNSPFAWDEVEELLINHGARFAPGAAIWIERFDPSDSEVGRAIRPLAGAPISADIGGVIAARMGEADADRWADLVLPTVERLLKRVPSESFLRALGIERADAGRVMSALVALYGDGARSNEHRQQIVGVADLLGPLDDQVRKQFILDLIIPLAHQGKEALDIAVDHLGLCLPAPRGTKGRLRDTLRERAKGKDQEMRVDEALLRTGLIKRSGFFGRGRTDAPDA